MFSDYTHTSSRVTAKHTIVMTKQKTHATNDLMLLFDDANSLVTENTHFATELVNFYY